MSSRIELAPKVVVSRETFDKLSLYESLLKRWQSKVNLVANSTLDDIWWRHFVDSAQIINYGERARRWVDLGSGAGFPGLVIAIQLSDIVDSAVHLIESDAKKCSFLRAVIRETGARATVHHGRIEDFVSELDVEAVTARALASLPRVVEYAAPVLKKGAIGIFPCGHSLQIGDEIAAVGGRYRIDVRSESVTSTGRIAVVRKFDSGVANIE